MTYTTQGLMTASDLYDHQLLHDMHVHPDCPGHEDEGGTAFCRAVEDCPDSDQCDHGTPVASQTASVFSSADGPFVTYADGCQRYPSYS